MSSLLKIPCASKVYLIDNSPTDELKLIARSYPINIMYLHSPKNPGYGSSHNVAIRLSKAEKFEYHLVLNSDVYFNNDFLSPMIAYMNKNSNVGLMMPKVFNDDGSIQRLCKLVPTPIDLLLRRFLHSKLKLARNEYFELHKSGYDKIMFVPYLSGCCMLIRNQVLDIVGYFDERFFMYPEDIDLSRRVAEKYETIFFPETFVYHEHGAASYKSKKMMVIHAFNIIKYYNKWGWIFDESRDKLNKKTLSRLNLQ
jgi:GT2 family glycosyltransferase